MDKKNIKRFAEIEKELNLFERSYDGFYYWQYVRFYLSESLFGNRVEIETQIKKKNGVQFYISLLVRVAVGIIKDLKILNTRKNYDILVFKETLLKNRFFDYWEMPQEVKKYCFRSTVNYGKTELSEHIFAIPHIKSILAYKKDMVLGRISRDIQEDEFICGLVCLLRSEFGQSMSENELIDQIQRAHYVRKYFGEYFHNIFKITNCKALLTIVYYQPYLIPAYEEAKKQGITVIEMQHGVVNNHISYWFEDTRGIHNYTPDYLLTFGEIHNRWVKLVEGSQAISVGFPYQEVMKEKLENIKPKENVVVVYPEADDRFETVINEFINKFPKYDVLIKVHPLHANNIEAYYPLLYRNKKAKFITSQVEGIYYWLKYASHHVMASTTVGFEAMAFDHCNVYIAENVPHEQTQVLLDWNCARGFKNADELLQLIESSAKNVNAESRRTEIWKKNSKDNIERFFKELYRTN